MSKPVPSNGNDKYIVAKMPTVIIVPVDGINLKLEAEQKKIEAKVEAKVKEIVNKLKASHEKFEDPDFGPTEKDEYGALSFYASLTLPNPAGSKYPPPNTMRWERPQYDDNKFGASGAAATEGKKEEGEEEEGGAEEEEGEDDEFGYTEEESDVRSLTL